MWKREKDRDRLKGCEFRNPGIRRKLIFLSPLLLIASRSMAKPRHDQTKWSSLNRSCALSSAGHKTNKESKLSSLTINTAAVSVLPSPERKLSEDGPSFHWIQLCKLRETTKHKIQCFESNIKLHSWVSSPWKRDIKWVMLIEPLNVLIIIFRSGLKIPAGK